MKSKVISKAAKQVSATDIFVGQPFKNYRPSYFQEKIPGNEVDSSQRFLLFKNKYKLN